MDESKLPPAIERIKASHATAAIARHFEAAAEAAYVEAWLRSLVLKETMRQRGFLP